MFILNESFRLIAKNYKWKYLMSKLKISIFILIRFNSGSYVKRLEPWGENYVARKKEIMIFIFDGFRTYVFDIYATT